MQTVLRPADFVFGLASAFLAALFAAGAGWNIKMCIYVLIVSATLIIFLAKRFWREALFFFRSFLIGIFYFYAFFAWRDVHTKLPSDAKAIFTVLLTDEPTPVNRALMVPSKAEPPFAGSLVVFAPEGSDIRYGDLIQIEGKVAPPQTTGEDPSIFSNQVLVLAHHRGFFLREWLITIKNRILAGYQALLPGDQAALLGGITFGSKVSFDAATKQAMALSGTTHLVAISGYNITIVIIATGNIFGRFFSRRTNFVLSVICICLFILMVGFAASGVRAAIMGFIALVAKEMGENFSMRNAITFTAVFMALRDPMILTRDMSFILSFASLLGIVYLGPAVKKLFKQTEPGILDWKENAITTLSAQLAVAPVLIRTFGQFSAVAILANILILSTVPLTMFLGAALALLDFVSMEFALLGAKIVGLMLWYQLTVIRLFAKLVVPLPISFNSNWVMGFYYFILAIFIVSYSQKDDGLGQKI